MVVNECRNICGVTVFIKLALLAAVFTTFKTSSSAIYLDYNSKVCRYGFSFKRCVYRDVLIVLKSSSNS